MSPLFWLINERGKQADRLDELVIVTSADGRGQNDK